MSRDYSVSLLLFPQGSPVSSLSPAPIVFSSNLVFWVFVDVLDNHEPSSKHFYYGEGRDFMDGMGAKLNYSKGSQWGLHSVEDVGILIFHSLRDSGERWRAYDSNRKYTYTFLILMSTIVCSTGLSPSQLSRGRKSQSRSILTDHRNSYHDPNHNGRHLTHTQTTGRRRVSIRLRVFPTTYTTTRVVIFRRILTF